MIGMSEMWPWLVSFTYRAQWVIILSESAFLLISKGGLFSERFHLGSNLKKSQKDPEHYLFRWIGLRGVIWHLFWIFEQKQKTY